MNLKVSGVLHAEQYLFTSPLAVVSHKKYGTKIKAEKVLNGPCPYLKWYSVFQPFENECDLQQKGKK